MGRGGGHNSHTCMFDVNKNMLQQFGLLNLRKCIEMLEKVERNAAKMVAEWSGMNNSEGK